MKAFRIFNENTGKKQSLSFYEIFGSLVGHLQKHPEVSILKGEDLC